MVSLGLGTPGGTESVREKLIGQARKAFEKAAGDDGKVSKADAASLPADYQRAVEFARKDHKIVTVDRAVDSYAHHVSKVLEVKPSHIDFGNDPHGKPGQLWTFVNAKTQDAVSFTILKGTL